VGFSSQGRAAPGVLLALLVALLCGPPPTAAEDVPAPELLLFEEPTVSAAAKHPQTLRDAPSAVSVITRQDIRRFGYRTLAEALRSLRGFYGTYDRNYDYIGVRGFLRPGDYNDRILLLVNGHAYNDDVYGTAPLGNDFGIDLEAIDHIEVVRGPGSALYGGNALFAVVNVVTVTGRDVPGVQALAETGSFWRKRGQASAGHTFANGADVFGSGSVLDVDGQRDLFYPAFDSPRTNFGHARNVDSERAYNFFLSGRHGGFVLQGGANSREKQIPTGAFGTTFNDPGTTSIDRRHFTDLRYTAEPLDDVTVTARAFYDGMQYHGTFIYGGGPGRTKNEDLAQSHWLGSEVTTRWQVAPTWALTGGTEYTYHPRAEQENFDLPTGRQYLKDVRHYGTLGVYGQGEWSPLESLTLVAGARYDRWYDRIEEASPRVAAIWNARPGTNVKLLWGRAFRAPNLYEQYYAYSGAGLRSLANTSLDPERITTWEAVLEQHLWRGAEGTIALYRYDIEELIDQVTVPSAPGTTVVQYRNGEDVEAQGVETELRVPLPRGIFGRASYALQEARTEDGRLLSNSPKHLGVVGLTFPLPLGLKGGTQLLVVGPRNTIGGRRLEAAKIASLTLDYDTPWRGLAFSGSVYNFFDHSYPDPAGTEHRMDRIPQDAITFRLQARYAF
jgi:iron complex outermembrane receptor protein